VIGLLPDRGYAAHARARPCGPTGAVAGRHYQNEVDPAATPEQPSTDPDFANPRNEIWLDLRTDGDGNAVAGNEVPCVFSDRAPASVVIHQAEATATGPGDAGSAGRRVACLNVPFDHGCRPDRGGGPARPGNNPGTQGGKVPRSAELTVGRRPTGRLTGSPVSLVATRPSPMTRPSPTRPTRSSRTRPTRSSRTRPTRSSRTRPTRSSRTRPTRSSPTRSSRARLSPMTRPCPTCPSAKNRVRVSCRRLAQCRLFRCRLAGWRGPGW
jgi:hypothetical protein